MSVLVMPSSGGEERRLIDTSVWPDARLSSLSYLSWTADGKWLIGPENDGTGERIGLTAISVQAGDRHALTHPPAQWLADVNPVVAPESNIIYFVRLASVVAGELYALRLTDHLRPAAPPQRLHTDSGVIGNLVWDTNTQGLVFPMWDRTNLWRIYWFRWRQPGNPRMLASIGENARYVSVASGARRLVVTREHQDQDVWRVNVPEPGSGTPGHDRRQSAPHPFITSTRLDRNAYYSPDGTKIAFQSARSGFAEIWLADSAGNNARQLTFLKARTTGFPSWSPDGHRIAFHSRVKPQGDIFLIQDDGRNPTRLTNDEEEDACPRWSRDGRFIYFASHRTGRYEMWKISADGGNVTQVTKNGGAFGFESPDGHYLYFSKYGGPELWRVALDSGREERVEQVALSNDTAWDVTSAGIWYIGTAGPRSVQALNLLLFSTGAVKPITSIPAAVDFGLSVSPDERSVLYSQSYRPTSDLMLVEQFP
jgi:Tol biopolymer transport system component